MALPINIGDLLSGNVVEWERIEFKKGFNDEAILHTMCAFANDFNNWGGGYIVIGIAGQEGKLNIQPIGIEPDSVDRIQKELLRLCNLMHPVYFPIVEPITYKNKQLLIIWVPGGQTRPYKAPASLSKNNKDYKYYIRHFSSTVAAKDAELKELVSLAGVVPFDDRINHHASIADIKLTLIKEFLHEVQSDLYHTASNLPFETLCRQMNIAYGADECIKPLNIGLLLFNDKPQDFIRYSQIELVHFATDAGGDMLDEKIFSGPIQQQIKDVLRYMKNMILKEQIIKYPNREKADRFFNYPYDALEESVVNAMYHRDYDIREPVEIRINKDCIQILNFPGPDRSIRDCDIEKKLFVTRRYRNRRIGEYFKEMKLTEGRCTGIPKIRTAMKNNGSAEPIFETDANRTFFLVTLPKHPFFVENEIGDLKDNPDNGAINEAINGAINGDIKTIILLLEKNPYLSKPKLEEVSGLSKRKIENIISSLKKQGIIVRIGSNKTGYWKIIK